MEWAPSTSPNDLRLLTIEETERKLTADNELILSKANTLLGFHALNAGRKHELSRKDVANAIQAITDEVPSADLLDFIMSKFSRDKEYLTLKDFILLAKSGVLQPKTANRHWVAVTIAEAETIRRILHVRKDDGNLIEGSSAAVALRYSPTSGPQAPAAGDGGVIFDLSKQWVLNGKPHTNVPKYEASMVHSAFRFFDCDMHFAPAALHILIREIQCSTKEKEIFFNAVIGCRRRMDVKVLPYYSVYCVISYLIFRPVLDCITTLAIRLIPLRTFLLIKIPYFNGYYSYPVARDAACPTVPHTERLGGAETASPGHIHS